MKAVSIRELTHHFANYLKAVNKGERIVILERNLPVAEMVPHNSNLLEPAWKRPIQKISVKGETFSETTSRLRAEER
jgi:prevent-host-death family protein